MIKMKDIPEYDSVNDFKIFFTKNPLEKTSSENLKKVCMRIALLKAHGELDDLDYFFEMTSRELENRSLATKFKISIGVSIALSISSLFVSILSKS